MPDRMLVVTDVDNTLFDFVGVWAGAFAAMLHTLEARTAHPVECWTAAARAVHACRGAVECPSLLCELAASPTWPAGVDPDDVLPAAASAYQNYWDLHLAAFAGVREALGALAEQQHTIVAYTEADVSIAATRLARLGLGGVIRRVFGRPPLPPARQPAWCTVSVLRNGPIAVDFIPREESKPNPTGLRTIISMCGATPDTSLYIGDNLWKDVVMAQALGVKAVWARYGTGRRPDQAALLERVAHWTSEAVAAERNSNLASVRPHAILDDPRDLRAVVAECRLAAMPV